MLTLDKLSQNLINAEYAVRGKIVIRAQELEQQGKKITYCNIQPVQELNLFAKRWLILLIAEIISQLTMTA